MVELVQVKHFVRPYMKLYQDPDQDQHQDQDQNQNQNQHNKIIIIVCKEDRDWTDSETGEFYTGLNTCDINMITSKRMIKFKNSVIVLDDMGDKLNKDIS